jgi:hypothetical protein
MMLLLVPNVRLYSLNHGWIHTESAVSILPRKFDALFAEPSRGVRLEFLYRLSDGHRRGQFQKHVDVIRRSSDGERLDFQIVRDAVKVCPKLILQFSRNRMQSSFRAENEMDKVCVVVMRHGTVPFGDSHSIPLLTYVPGY